jgi:hypothetical protein
MAILDRNSGTFNGTSFNVTRSTGNFGTGTTIVVAVFGNTVINTPAGWAQRTSSVVSVGLYSYDKTGAGESSIAFTNSAGSGVWFAWEMSSGSSWVTGTSAQNTASTNSYAVASITPTAGDRHLLAVAGGNGAGQPLNVTAFSGGYTEWADVQVTAGDWSFAAAADLNVTANGSTGYTTTATFNNVTAGVQGGINLAYVNTGGGADTTPPTVPTGLTVGTVASTTAALSWTASTDTVGVTGYEIEITGP